MDATIWSIRYIGIEDEYLAFHFTDPRRIDQLARTHQGKLRITSSTHCYWPLRPTTSVATAKKPDRMTAKPTPPTPPEPIESIIKKTDFISLLQSILQA